MAKLETENKILVLIEGNLVAKDDWLTFELHSSKNVHPAFFDKLIEKYQDLSSNEIKLCAYLRLNRSSKEIASIMNISIGSLEQGLWRLREKLELSKDSSMENYIQSF